MLKRFRIGLLLAGLVIFSAPPVWGSRFINLTEILATSETVAIAKIIKLPSRGMPRKARLNVLRVLKGHLGAGEQEVSFAENEHPDPTLGEFVAFFDKQRQWRYSAAPMQGTTIDSGLLAALAFDDRNAPRVWPAFLSLLQLKDYLRTGKLLYSFRGQVWFPQRGKIPWSPSGMRIEGTYDAVRDSAHVNGLGQLAGFPAEPRFSLIRGRNKPRLVLEYSDRGDRPLEFRGVVERLDQKTGDLIAKVAVTEPNVLSEATLKKYLTTPKLGACAYKFRLHCLATKDCPKLDLLVSLGKRSDLRVEGWGSGPLQIDTANLGFGNQSSAISDVPAQDSPTIDAPPSDGVLRVVTEARAAQTVVLDFNLAKPGADVGALGWHFLGEGDLESELLYRANAAPLHGTLSLYDGKALRAITSFSVDVEPLVFGPVSGK
jgi:hypothetical protein